MPKERENRLLAIGTAPAPDLQAVRFVVLHGHFSRLFLTEAELSARHSDTDFGKVASHPCTIRSDLRENSNSENS